LPSFGFLGFVRDSLNSYMVPFDSFTLNHASDAPITVLAVIAAMAVHDSSDGMQCSDSSGLGMGAHMF
jgi:hypothetical protein